jgi:AraC-like DNA-binding protein
MTAREPTLSTRLIWPFARLLGTDARALAVLHEMGLRPSDLAERDARIGCRVAFTALQRAVDAFGDPLLGLRAGTLVDEGTLDVLEHAARAAATLGDAMQVVARYFRVTIEGVEAWLDTSGAEPSWCFASTVPTSPAINDLMISAALTFAKRNCEIYRPPPEIRLMHPRPSYADAYAEFFETKVSFDAPYDAIVLHPIALQVPMRARNTELAIAFERKAEELAHGRASAGSVSRRVRESLAAQLGGGSANMAATAKRLGMGVATLRRRLEAEGASFSDILDDMRRQAALRHLQRDETSISDIAFMLGFSDVRAFGRAFKRWTGKSPSEFRKQGEPR